MNEKIIKILKDLIEIDNSGKDESKCVEKILEILSEYKFKYKIIQSQLCGRDSLVIEVGNIKSEDKNIAFIGHMDTVSPGELDLWKNNPFKGKLEGDKFYGRGTSDMKGGLTAMIILLIDILENKIELEKKIKFIFTADEENTGFGIKNIDENGILKDVELVIVPEPTNMQIGLSEKGAIWIEVEGSGKIAHASMPEKGVNAIEKCMMFYEKIKKFLENSHDDPLLGKNTAQITKISSGIQTNIIPDKCTVNIDMRVSTVENEILLEKIKTLAKEVEDRYIGSKFKIDVINNRKLLTPNADKNLLNKLEKIYKESDMEFKFCGVTYYTDLSQIKELESKKFLILGPGYDFMAHKVNEYISLENIQLAYKVFKQIII